jgi:hypothetical protein
MLPLNNILDFLLIRRHFISTSKTPAMAHKTLNKEEGNEEG